MEFAFPWPMTSGEWRAWASAAATVLFGLVLLFAPRLSFRLLRLKTRDGKPEAIAEARSTMAGFYLGLGVCCVLLGNQPFLYNALGFSWLFAAFGRVISMLSDGGNKPFNWIALVIQLVLAALPLGFVFGVFP
ncbi:DUF4345 family protein [Arvimicrobium flavum]|uniref:AGROH133_08824 family phage infection protein n=1 Tax=Arvimicrobium flavum TaxID=3393320 RepID=UPI00237B98CE|nr:DUF4345 family protein [Mesorhizobium shangrilense]